MDQGGTTTRLGPLLRPGCSKEPARAGGAYLEASIREEDMRCRWPTGAVLGALLSACPGAPTDPSAAPLAMQTGRLAMGSEEMCYLEDSGEVVCWGNSREAFWLTPGDGSLRFVALRGGYTHSCGLTADSTAYCWGSNTWGQLGNGTLWDSRKPVRVDTEAKFVEINPGGTITCGLEGNGRAYCWGSNWTGGLGIGTRGEGTYRSRPVPVLTRERFKMLASKGVCGLTPRGTVFCWGHTS